MAEFSSVGPDEGSRRLYLPGASLPQVQEDWSEQNLGAHKSKSSALYLEAGCDSPPKKPPEVGPVLSSQEKVDKVVSKRSCRSWTVAKVALNTNTSSNEKVGFVEAVEPAMQLYLVDCCADGPSAGIRAARSFAVILSLLFLLPALSFAIFVIPFPAPHEGFARNWAFNLVAHPIINYIPARAQLELLARVIDPSERHRVRAIVRYVPLIDPIVCVSIHSVASLFGIFPLPYAVMTGCVPGILATLFAARYLAPKELLTPDVLRFMKFLLLSWVVWATEFAVLMLWLLTFPLLTAVQQALFSFAVNGMLSAVGWALESVGQWMGLPKYYTTELKPMILFICFLFTAALFSSTKTIWVFLLMLGQDAGKALAMLVKIWFFLARGFARDMDKVDDDLTAEKRWKFCQRCLSFKSMMVEMSSATFSMSKHLRDIFAEFRWHTQDSLQQANIKVGDARLLDHFARFFVLFAMVEICEVLVPLIYIIVTTLLYAVDHNRPYFYVFKDINFADALRGNLIAFLIEASIFLTTHVVLLRTIGFNLLNFAGLTLQMDFWYWLFALGTSCVAWAMVLIEHSGTDLELIRSWLSF